jgi:hypothetical protein
MLFIMKRKRRSKMIRFNPEPSGLAPRGRGMVFGSRKQVMTVAAVAAVAAVGIGAYMYRDKIKALLAPGTLPQQT